jgi:hypothetical protein
VDPDDVADELADLLGRVEGVHRGLGDVGDLLAEEKGPKLLVVELHDVLAADLDGAAFIEQWREIEAHQAQGQGGLPAAGFAGDAEDRPSEREKDTPETA